MDEPLVSVLRLRQMSRPPITLLTREWNAAFANARVSSLGDRCFHAAARCLGQPPLDAAVKSGVGCPSRAKHALLFKD